MPEHVLFGRELVLSSKFYQALFDVSPGVGMDYLGQDRPQLLNMRLAFHFLAVKWGRKDAFCLR